MLTLFFAVVGYIANGWVGAAWAVGILYIILLTISGVLP